MKEEIKVSIIVPVYQVENYLQECIDSILAQTHRNIEIILVDDGGPDKSGDIADKNAVMDSRIKVIHKKNGGVSSARNVGLVQVTGDYFCFADADDRLEPDYVEYLLSLVVRYHTEISLTTDHYTTFNTSGAQNNAVEEVSGLDAACAILSYKMPIGVYCKLFSRDLLKRGLRFEEELFIGEGFNFNVDSFMMANNVAIGHRKVYFYRKDNEESAMTRFKIEKVQCALKAIDYIEKKHGGKDDYLDKCIKFARWHTSCDMLSFITNARAGKQYPIEYRQCYKKARRDALAALSLNIYNREKIKAVLTFIYPKTLALLIRWRSALHKRQHS